MIGLAVAVVLLGIAVVASLAVGARPIPIATVVQALQGSGDSYDAGIIVDQRVPRTAIGLCCGIALGLSGTIMQALTRNALADPGLLGVNAGAAAAVVTALTFFDINSMSAMIWLSLVGAASVSAVVYVVGAGGRRGENPATLVLTGAGIGVALASYNSLLNYLNSQTYDQIRFWAVGSFAGRPADALFALLPFLAVGAVLALALGRSLNTLALGDHTATALGMRVGWTKLLGALAAVLLCGSATAVAGPIAFVGLAVPHAARLITGSDIRWVLGYGLFLAPGLLLGADTVGRVLADEEFQVGVVTVWIGAPLFLLLVRYGRVREL